MMSVNNVPGSGVSISFQKLIEGNYEDLKKLESDIIRKHFNGKEQQLDSRSGTVDLAIEKTTTLKAIECDINKDSKYDENFVDKLSCEATNLTIDIYQMLSCTKECEELENSRIAVKDELSSKNVHPLVMTSPMKIKEKKLVLCCQVECVNPNCQSGYDLTRASAFVLTYFGVVRQRNILQKVCRECFYIALKHQEVLSGLLKNHVPLLLANFPDKKDVVTVDHTEECDEEDPLPENVITEVEEHLLDILGETVKKYDLDFQIEQSQVLLDKKFETLEANNYSLNRQFSELDNQLQEMRQLIYQNFIPNNTYLPPLDIETENAAKDDEGLLKSTQFSDSGDAEFLASVSVFQGVLPPAGKLIYPPLAIGSQVYIMKNHFYPWLRGRIIHIYECMPEGSVAYGAKFSRTRTTIMVKGTEIAYNEPSCTRYPVGTRVIAHSYQMPADHPNDIMKVGVIGEIPKQINNFRYLVFFDDGYAYYVHHNQVRLVCESSTLVYKDVHFINRNFIKNYLRQYPEYPMVKLHEGQTVRVMSSASKKLQGMQWDTMKVVEIDASLVKVCSKDGKKMNWIYRGSSLLEQFCIEHISKFSPRKKKIEKLEESDSNGIDSPKKRKIFDCKLQTINYNNNLSPSKVSKNVARKSTTKITSLNYPLKAIQRSDKSSRESEFRSKGYLRCISLKSRLLGQSFIPHQCSPFCTTWINYSDNKCKGINPLARPLLYGFERQTTRSKGQQLVMYTGPCGRRLRNLRELHWYLRMTKCPMGVDLFDFDYWVHILDEFHLEPTMFFTYVKDISNGREHTPVSCVNELGHSWPVPIEYSSVRIPQDGVNICLDEGFLVCCECLDDCKDKTKCACCQLTIEGTKFGLEGVMDTTAGYQFKRLPEPVTTGIYECNSRCKCSSTCLNRVVQNSMKLNLQIFKTLKKGWGLRTLNDIPAGGFICTYVGRLHTEQSANNDGRMFGDEYLAELDYIDVVEKYKEHYEETVVEPQESNSQVNAGIEKPNRGNSNKLLINEKNNGSPSKGIGMRKLSQEKSKSEKKNISDSTQNDLIKKFKSVRELFGERAQDCYVMDAKSIGNIGRYLNHSCRPNVFVQNVFVDTHDIRFPWVAFFALTHITAGSELTWDYNYDIGSVPGKILYCYCNNAECRGRLL